MSSPQARGKAGREAGKCLSSDSVQSSSGVSSNGSLHLSIGSEFEPVSEVCSSVAGLREQDENNLSPGRRRSNRVWQLCGNNRRPLCPTSSPPGASHLVHHQLPTIGHQLTSHQLGVSVNIDAAAPSALLPPRIKNTSSAPPRPPSHIDDLYHTGA